MSRNTMAASTCRLPGQPSKWQCATFLARRRLLCKTLRRWLPSVRRSSSCRTSSGLYQLHITKVSFNMPAVPLPTRLHVGHGCSADGPRSIKEFNRQVAAWGQDAAGLKSSESNGKLPRGPGSEADPLSVHGDAADMLPRREDDYKVLEIVDASRHSVAAIAKAMRQPSEPKGLLDKLSDEAAKIKAALAEARSVTDSPKTPARGPFRDDCHCISNADRFSIAIHVTRLSKVYEV